MSALAEQVEYVSTQGIPMRRVWAMPSKNTFNVPPIRQLVKSYLAKSRVSVDPFARNKRWATYTNDLNPETAAEYHLDAIDFLLLIESKGVRPDFTIFDPPYSHNQIEVSYAGVGRPRTLADVARVGRWTKEKDCINRITPPGGVVLSCDWNSAGMGEKRGFEIIEMLIVCHGTGHNDTICTVERKVISAQQSIFEVTERLNAQPA